MLITSALFAACASAPEFDDQAWPEELYTWKENDYAERIRLLRVGEYFEM